MHKKHAIRLCFEQSRFAGFLHGGANPIRITHSISMSQLRNKPVMARAQQTLSAWRQFGPDVEFAGIKSSVLEAQMRNAQVVRDQILAAETLLDRLRMARDHGERALSEQLTLIGYGVCGHQDFGDDCALYRAMGYVPRSENRSGRPRKPKTLSFPSPVKKED